MNPFENKILNLTLQQYKSDIALQNVLKQGKKVIPDDANFKVYARTPQAIVQKNATDLMMNDLINDIQIQTMLKNAVPNYRPKKIQSEVTEEMIKDYQQESKKPVEINGKLYKFVPPDLDLDLEEVPPNLPPEGILNRRNDKEIQRLRLQYNQISPEIQLIMQQIEKNADDYNKGKINVDDYTSNNAFLMDAFEQRKAQGKYLSDSIDQLFNEEMRYKEEKTEREAQIDRIKKSNAQKLSAYEEALRLRNTGQEVAQQPDESDEDYAQRMIDVGHETLDPEDVKLDAQLYLYNNLKDKFGEFIEPNKVEWVLNTLVQEEGYEFLQKLKDRWPAVSKKIKETFGTLRRVDQETTIDFLTTEVFEPEKSRSIKESMKSESPSVSETSRRSGKPSDTEELRARSSSNVSDLTDPDFEAERTNWMDYLSPESRLALTDYVSPSSQRALSSSTPIRDSGSMGLQERADYKKELVEYCEQHDYKGVQGGNPKNMKIPALEKLIQSKRPLSGEGITSIDPLKTRFEIVDGEIQAGNNNPKLIREVRKLLKEMVAKKMVNLYEAKSHMNHLKKVIKI